MGSMLKPIPPALARARSVAVVIAVLTATGASQAEAAEPRQ
jgi:hypothetical protein